MIIERSQFGDGPCEFRVKVPSKVNLFLEVLEKRSDGYHGLDTLMMAISLFDELTIAPRDDEQLRLEISFPEGAGQALDDEDPAWDIPADQNNLVVRALELLRTSIGNPKLGAQIELHKRIPAFAGLGGGSANAAAALVLGALLWTKDWGIKQLQPLACKLGSDVNFFLEADRLPFWLARCTGRGEKIECLDCSQSLHLVVAHPPRGCSTKKVFSALSPYLGTFVPRAPLELIHALKEGDLNRIGSKLVNRLESAAETTNDWIAITRTRFDRYKHHGQTLSGSGSARFCLCESHEQAEKIATDINLHGEMRAFSVQSWQSPQLNEQIDKIRKSR